MKEITFAERVYRSCDSHWDKGKKSIVHHFLDENTPKSTIYDIIKRWENGLAAERKPGSGRKATIMTKTNVNRLANLINQKSGISGRILGKKVGCTQKHISKTIREKRDIKYRKRILAPDRTEQQQAVMRPRYNRMLKKFRGRDFILDDESYFTYKNSDKNANAGIY